MIKPCVICAEPFDAQGPHKVCGRAECKTALRKQGARVRRQYWRAHDPQKVRKAGRDYQARRRERDPDAARAYLHQWRAKNPGKVKAHKRAQRARASDAPSIEIGVHAGAGK